MLLPHLLIFNFQVQNNIEDFKTYISHYKAAQEETANFLSYYDTKVYFISNPPSTYDFLQCLKEWQVLEVRDTEETQFSRFLKTSILFKLLVPLKHEVFNKMSTSEAKFSMI